MSVIKPRKISQPLFAVGWREWCALPKLHIPAIKAKIDTGAKTSAIHAFDIRPIRKQGRLWVKFNVCPIQANKSITVACMAEVIDARFIMSSNGHKERRYVIKTPLQMGDKRWDIELTLSNRDPLQYRILLGRSALQEHVTINPAHSYRLEKRSIRSQLKLYLPSEL